MCGNGFLRKDVKTFPNNTLEELSGSMKSTIQYFQKLIKILNIFVLMKLSAYKLVSSGNIKARYNK